MPRVSFEASSYREWSELAVDWENCSIRDAARSSGNLGTMKDQFLFRSGPFSRRSRVLVTWSPVRKAITTTSTAKSTSSPAVDADATAHAASWPVHMPSTLWLWPEGYDLEPSP